MFSILSIPLCSRTCACFPVSSVPKIASTAVWANSIVALRVHVAGGRGSGAFINVCSKHEKYFNQNKYDEIECLFDIMISISQVRRRFWHLNYLTEEWREEVRIDWFSLNAQFEIYGTFLWLKRNNVWKKNIYLLLMLHIRNRSSCSILPEDAAYFTHLRIFSR